MFLLSPNTKEEMFHDCAYLKYLEQSNSQGQKVELSGFGRGQ